MNTKMYTSGEYLENNPTWHTEDSPWKAQQIYKILNNNNLLPKTVCEIGCGAGEILKQLSLKLDENVNFCGYEVSPQAYELCKERESDRVHFFLKNLLEEDKAFFDVLLVIDIIEHVEDYFGFLRKIRNKAEYKVFHIPLDLSAQTVHRSSPIIKGRQTVGHIHYFTKETAIASLIDTGYEIVDYFIQPVQSIYLQDTLNHS